MDKKLKAACNGAHRGCMVNRPLAIPQSERVQTYPWCFMARYGGRPMNVGNSMTGSKKPEKLTDRLSTTKCQNVSWDVAEKSVNRLQARIAKAATNKRWNDVRRLQYLLANSYYAKALAVREAAAIADGMTLGIDVGAWDKSAVRVNTLRELTKRGYKSRLSSRLCIYKRDATKKQCSYASIVRNLAGQALRAMAISAVSKTRNAKDSFVIYKERDRHDARRRIFNCMSHADSPKWVLKGEVKNCIMLLYTMQETLISALDLDNKGGASLIMHAEDGFVLVADSFEIVDKAREIIGSFLDTRGLSIYEAEIKVSHIDYGFDFLGWTFRKFDGRLIIKPSKVSIGAFAADLSKTILKYGKAWKQERLIKRLNKKIRCWVAYHMFVCASKAFAHIDFVLFNLLYRWAKRRHPKKGKWFVVAKYWHRRGGRSWVFAENEIELMKVRSNSVLCSP